MADSSGITLVDNTAPAQPLSSGSSSRQHSIVGRQISLTKHLSRTAVSDRLARRKYAKWQPDRLGLTSDSERSPSRERSRLRRPLSASSSSGPTSRQSSQQRNSSIPAANTGLPEHEGAGSTHVRNRTTTDPADQANNGLGQTTTITSTTTERPQKHSELDILYENQRGWFFFGIPLYSHSSLLNFDPPAWMTQDKRASAVNITNAQVPDPSWEWAWRTWYVDMSGDVDEQGWQYAFSFSTSKWHGTHPWLHSFVRRRRWVRLRTKAFQPRHRGQSGFEQAHMLNEDYFTIHSSKQLGREQSLADLSRVESGFLSRADTKLGEPQADEVVDIPSLVRAMRMTSIDRERIDALKKFINDGGEELYYLTDKIPEIMSMFLYQVSRGQVITYLNKNIYDLNRQISNSNSEDRDRLERKRDNLIRAVEVGKQHVTGPDVVAEDQSNSAAQLLDLIPASRQDSLLTKRAQCTNQPLKVTQMGEIKGIPKEAEVGKEHHIYQPIRQPAIDH
ncbi:Uncharacterized protein PECH_001005 [Penicillium ucsense]|uniref:Peroxin/Ferlin domain-containing protein n=1 Tax=Penicillium ucsense TaxID=2839758 RepID=A0A8J8VWQ4_9EURO|nr:Uncharacterized protein PECM_003660 [Penicillium ucsense]KAF7733178.1 Uncharacterized protein PECH_001005 [Penicillium ucsense]